jgi:hypothetical protein
MPLVADPEMHHVDFDLTAVEEVLQNKAGTALARESRLVTVDAMESH